MSTGRSSCVWSAADAERAAQRAGTTDESGDRSGEGREHAPAAAAAAPPRSPGSKAGHRPCSSRRTGQEASPQPAPSHACAQCSVPAPAATAGRRPPRECSEFDSCTPARCRHARAALAHRPDIGRQVTELRRHLRTRQSPETPTAVMIMVVRPLASGRPRRPARAAPPSPPQAGGCCRIAPLLLGYEPAARAHALAEHAARGLPCVCACVERRTPAPCAWASVRSARCIC